MVSLMNGTLKVISKVLAKSLSGVIDNLVEDMQLALIKRRHIFDSFICVLEWFIIANKLKKKGILWELDFKKVYDRVVGSFSLKCLMLETLE